MLGNFVRGVTVVKAASIVSQLIVTRILCQTAGDLIVKSAQL